MLHGENEYVTEGSAAWLGRLDRAALGYSRAGSHINGPITNNKEGALR